MLTRRTVIGAFVLLGLTASVAQAAVVVTIAPASTVAKTKVNGNVITPLGTYQLQGDATT
jgi:hypothetical protein